MIEIKAKMRLQQGTGKRETPFNTGYRPLFNFIPEMKTSGQITLIDRQQFFLGDEGIVKIAFLNRDYLGSDFRIGKTFSFTEGQEILGDGSVLEIL